MHKLGNLDDTELYKAYRDVGYNDYNATKMVEWTIDYNATTEVDVDRDLTRAQLERGYRLGVLNSAQLDEALEAMGYDNDKRAYIVELLDEGQRIDEGQEWLTLIRAQTVSGLMTVDDARNRLSELGFESGSVEHYGNLFAAYKEQPSKIPAKTDVKTFVKAKEISPDQAYDYMRALGYADNDIEIYLRTWAGGEERYREWVEMMMSVWDEYETRKRLPGSTALIDRMVTGGYSPVRAS
ncbi:unnamed protein product [marine sediment metagenome]|uniref:Uncharacterized protein n=1 Tax=marine sediment metagenome TaxID=412755 RepID=X0VGR5_9ZZZZ